jgi:hypothetical protein
MADPLTFIGRKKPISRSHCDPKCSQRLPTLHLKGIKPLRPKLAPQPKAVGAFLPFARDPKLMREASRVPETPNRPFPLPRSVEEQDARSGRGRPVR